MFPVSPTCSSSVQQHQEEGQEPPLWKLAFSANTATLTVDSAAAAAPGRSLGDSMELPRSIVLQGGAGAPAAEQAGAAGSRAAACAATASAGGTCMVACVSGTTSGRGPRASMWMGMRFNVRSALAQAADGNFSGSITAFTWSPDGKRLALARGIILTAYDQYQPSYSVAVISSPLAFTPPKSPS